MKVQEVIQLVEKLPNLNEIYDSKERVIIAFVYAYFNDLYQYEKLERDIIIRNRNLERGVEDDSLVYLKEKRTMHEKYWSNKAQYYIPCSVGSEPKYDWSRVSEIDVMETGDDENPQFLFTCRYQTIQGISTTIKKAYLIKLYEGQLGIEYEFFG